MSMPVNAFRSALTCKKCERIYDDPVCLPTCFHKFCRRCIIEGDLTEAVQSDCPECGEGFQIDPNAPLVTDPTLKVLLATLEQPKPAQLGKVCSADHLRDLFCMKEKMEICGDCFASKHDGHEIRPLRCYKNEIAIKYVDDISRMERELQKKEIELESLKNTLQEYMEATQKTIEMGKLAEHEKIKQWIADGEMSKSDAVDNFFVLVQEYERLTNIKVEVIEEGMNDSMIRYSLPNVSKLDRSKHYHSNPVLVKGVKWRLTVKLDPLPGSHKKRGATAGKTKGSREELMLGLYLNAALHKFQTGEKYSAEHEMRLVRKVASQGGDEVRTHVNQFPASNGALISGWPDFVSYSDLCDDKNGWLKNDTMELVCEFTVKRVIPGTKEDMQGESDGSDD